MDKFQCHTFCPSKDIKQSVLLSSYLDNWWRHELFEFLLRQLMTSWTLRFIFDHSLKQWLTGRKRRKDRNTKNWISRERKELFRRWNKKHFSQFLKTIIWWKNTNLIKTADTSFKVAIFSDLILVSNYHGCKEKVIN